MPFLHKELFFKGKHFSQKNMIQNKMLNILNTIEPLDEIEKNHISLARDRIEKGYELFRPKAKDMHLVSYFAVIDKKTRKILLTEHKKSTLWLPSGGHIEENEHPKDTVIREAKEELNIQAEFFLNQPIFLTICETKKTQKHPITHKDISFWFVLKGDSENHYLFDKREFQSIYWFEFEKISFEKSDPNINRFLQKLKIHLNL